VTDSARAQFALTTARLRPHQREAVTAAVTALTRTSRTTVVSACGTGKTWIAAAVAQRTAARTLVVVPTLDLIAQTITSWDTLGHRYPIAVCADEELTRTRRGGRAHAVTTSPATLAALARSDAKVYATYASLPVIIAAHRDHGLEPWGLTVIDEAHRTSGKLGRPWSAIHHDTLIPSLLRLYMTATPRVLDETGDVVASMDDQEIYGPVAYRLGMGDAITRGILADYRIAVPVVSGPDIAELIKNQTVMDAGAAVPADQLALAAALLHTADELDLRRIVSYHTRVARARSFARAAQAAANLPGRSDQPEVWARATWSKQPGHVRRDLLHTFATADGVHLLANARLLGEGIDVPEMDAVVFADPKNSVIDTVQAIGRALRPSTTEKTATIVIPVFISPDQNAEGALDNSAWAPLWKTLRALRAHDERIEGRVRTAARTGTDHAGHARRSDLSWLHTTGIDLPDDFTLALQLRVLDKKSAEWRRGYQAAVRYHKAHQDLGCVQDYADTQGFALGSWLSWQRWLHNTGRLTDARRDALEGLGIVWNPRASAWERGLEAAQRCKREIGHLAVPREYTVGAFALGTWLENQRRRDITPKRLERLNALDPFWNPAWPLLWQRQYYRLREYRQGHGDCQVPRTYTAADDTALGEWVLSQRRSQHELHQGQRDLLNELGFDWDARSPHERAWQAGLEAARRYHAEHGNLDVPQKHVDEQGYKLGVWINNTRRRAARLAPERRAALAELGMTWPPSVTDLEFTAPVAPAD
jgi:superfamily II DNA or RNA helicase